MKNKVSIWLNGYTTVEVDGESFYIEGLSINTISEKLPETINPSEVNGIDWNILNENKITFVKSNGGGVEFDSDKYNDFIQPYVDIWQAEKDKQDQEQEEAEAERNKFENRQARALTQLNSDFETVKERANVVSSLGFTADANSTANENVNGLLLTIGEGTVQFCDYYNQFHELNKVQLETLQSEIIQNAQSLYAQKWQYRTALEACTDNEELDAVIATIKFTYMDFSTPTE